MLKHPLVAWQEWASNWTDLFPNFGKSVLLPQIGAKYRDESEHHTPIFQLG